MEDGFHAPSRGCGAGENVPSPEGFFDAQCLVPLRRALRSRERADLELTRPPSHRKVNDRDILRLARSRRYDSVQPASRAVASAAAVSVTVPV